MIGAGILAGGALALLLQRLLAWRIGAALAGRTVLASALVLVRLVLVLGLGAGAASIGAPFLIAALGGLVLTRTVILVSATRVIGATRSA